MPASCPIWSDIHKNVLRFAALEGYERLADVELEVERLAAMTHGLCDEVHGVVVAAGLSLELAAQEAPLKTPLVEHKVQAGRKVFEIRVLGSISSAACADRRRRLRAKDLDPTVGDRRLHVFFRNLLQPRELEQPSHHQPAPVARGTGKWVLDSSDELHGKVLPDQDEADVAERADQELALAAFFELDQADAANSGQEDEAPQDLAVLEL